MALGGLGARLRAGGRPAARTAPGLAEPEPPPGGGKAEGAGVGGEGEAVTPQSPDPTPRVAGAGGVEPAAGDLEELAGPLFSGKLEFDPGFSGPVGARRGPRDSLGLVWMLLALGYIAGAATLSIMNNPLGVQALASVWDGAGARCGAGTNAGKSLLLWDSSGASPDAAGVKFGFVPVCVDACPSGATKIYQQCVPKCDASTDGDLYLLWKHVDNWYSATKQAFVDMIKSPYILWVGFGVGSLTSMLAVQTMGGAVFGYIIGMYFVLFSLCIGLGVYALLLKEDDLLALSECPATARDMKMAVKFSSYAFFGFAGLLLGYTYILPGHLRVSFGFLSEAHRVSQRLEGYLLLVWCNFCLLGGAFMMLLWGLGLWMGLMSTLMRSWLSTPFAAVLVGAHLFCSLWCLHFIISFSNLVYAGAVAGWFWTRPPRLDKLTRRLILKSIVWTTRYHTGTASLLALKSMLGAPLAPVRFFRDNRPNRALSKPQIALHGYGLAQGGAMAEALYSRHYWPWRRCLGAVTQISLLGVLILSFLLVVITVVSVRVLGVLVFRSALAPGAAVGLLGLTLSTSAFTMNNTAAETLLQCLCEDMERNDGTPMRRYFMPPPLREFLGTLFPDFFRTVVHVKGGAPEREKVGLLHFLRFFRQSLRALTLGGESADPQKELERLASLARQWSLKDSLSKFWNGLRGLVWKKRQKKNLEQLKDLAQPDDDNISLSSQDSWNI